MSLLHALASRVETVRTGLPMAEVSVARGRLSSATALLAATLESSAASTAAPLLASATSHLDAAAGALWRAGDELDRYLASVGLVSDAAAVVVSGSCPWADRVDVLTGQVGAARPAVVGSLSVDAVLAAAVRAAAGGSAVALRQALVSAPPAVGWALGARAAGMLGVVSPELVRRGAADRLAALLPGLPAAAGSALVCRALRLPAPSVRAHAADVAAVGVVLVSVVFGQTGRS
ncbi:hypothetical protein AB0J74_21465 [Asanoa sp. NPDC049573]|uniref:hypothetical protein n=1 Tax=Asanoa sp. NPDC049573 TaxID=3155396 RepID=UPI003417B706